MRTITPLTSITTFVKAFVLVLFLILASVMTKAQNVIIVDPSGSGNFTTIAAALNSINGTTISQKTIIRVKPGFYDDRLLLDSVTGTSPQKQIVIESFTGDTADVYIQYDSVTVFPSVSSFNIDKTKHVLVQNLTFRNPSVSGNTISLGEGVDNIVFQGNHFYKANNSNSSSMIGLKYTFDADDYNIGSLIIRNNHATNVQLFSRSITLFKLAYLELTNNQVDYDFYTNSIASIQANDVLIKGNNYNRISLGSIYNSGKVRIIENKCICEGVCIGFGTNNVSDSAALIANNFLTSVTSTTLLISSGRVNIYNNSIYGLDSNSQRYGIYMSDGDSVQIVNNIIAGKGKDMVGISLHDTIFPSSFRCDYNNYYIPSGHLSSYLTSVSYVYGEDVNDHILRYGIDSNSIQVNPLFVGDSNLHVRNASLKGKGIHLSEIRYDIDGDERDPNDPIIGADVISESIDLVPNSFVAFNGNFYPGKTMEVEYKVDNSGGLDLSTIAWIDKIYLSKDQTVDQNDILLKAINNNFNVDAGASYNRKQSVSIPYTSGGTYYFILVTNQTNKNFENTTNNTLVSQSFSLPTPQLPDLEVTAVTVPSSLYSGKSFSLEWTVKNTGNAPTTGNWSDYVYVATNTALLNSPDLRKSDSLLKVKISAPKGLQVNESYTSTSTFSVPIKFAGNLYYRVQTNANKGIFEQDTTFQDNGKVSAALNILQSPLPDLAVTGLNIPSSAFSGDTISVNWTVTNKGQQKTYRTDRFYRATPLQGNPKMWYDKIVVTKNPFYDSRSKENITKAFYSRPANDELEVDSSYTINADISFDRCEYGWYYVFAVTNYTNSTFELRYDNNYDLIDSIELILEPNPDLTPTALTVNGTVASGKNMTIDYTILNDGFADKKGGYHRDQFYLHKGSQWDAGTVVKLGQVNYPDDVLKGEDYSKTVTFQVPYDVYGDYYLTVFTDVNDIICEAPNEGNNFLTTSQFNISLSPQPDLVCEALNLPDTLNAGQNFTLILKTENQGDISSNQSYFVNQVLLTGLETTKLTNYTVPIGLEKDAVVYDTINVSIPLSAQEGLYIIEVNADQNDRVFEHSGEFNNTWLSKSITVLRDLANVPDLEVVNLSIVESNPRAGDLITVDVEVKNNSRTTSLTGWKDLLILTDDNGTTWKQEPRDHIGRINQGETVTEQFTFQLPFEVYGSLNLEYWSNYRNRPLEYILSNNNESVTFPVGQYIPPDLEAVNINAQQCCKVYSLQLDTLEITVENNGIGDLLGRSYFSKVYLSDDIYLDQYDYLLATHQQFGAILSGSSEKLIVPVKYPTNRSGDLYYIVVIDNDNDIYEAQKEDNNTYASGYTISLSNEITDLSLDSVKVVGYSGKSDPYIHVDYQFSKPIGDSLERDWSNYIMLSKDKQEILDAIRVSSEEYTANLPSGTATFNESMLGSIPRDLEPGYYFVGMLLDQYNEVYEFSESNNILYSKDSFYFDFSVPLTLDQLKDTFWYEGIFASRLYYHVDRPADKGMIIDLDVSDDDASTEMYHRAGNIPSNLKYDYKYNNPFLADQEIIVPVTDTSVRDYIFVNPTYVPPVYELFDPKNNIINKVPYSIYAQSAEFSILSVYPENGSSYGLTSVSVIGFDFDNTTSFYLIKGSDTIYPKTTSFISSSEAIIYLDLKDRDAGDYDVKAVKPSKTALLEDGFKVIQDGFEEPWVNIDIASAELTRRYSTMNVNFGNYSNTNGFDYWLVIALSNTTGNLDNLNTTYVGSSEDELNEKFGHDWNIPGDSTHIDVDGTRYFVYWIPNLAAKSQTTHTYLVNHSLEDSMFIYGLLFRQPTSVYTMSGDKNDLNQSTTVYELYEAFTNNAGVQNKRTIDCDDIDINAVQGQLTAQTLVLADNVHGGVGTFGSVKSMDDVAQKAYESWKSEILLPIQAGDRSPEVAKKMFKDMVLEKKSGWDIAKDYLKKASDPIFHATDQVYKPEPPFSDLVKEVFSCLDNDPDLVKTSADCIHKTYHQINNTTTYTNLCKKKKPQNQDLAIVRWVKSFDPNEIVGPEGTTDLRYVDQESTMPYIVRFENKSDASAPAVAVQINNPLDSAFRLQSFKLTEVGFGDTAFYFNGENKIDKVLELGPKYNFQKLHVVAGLDLINNRAIWRLTTIDPATGNPITDPFGGFLPPNDSSGIGEGYIKYEVDLKPDLEGGLRITNYADIIFDQNEIIGTNTWSNIVTSKDAYSAVNSLAEYSPIQFDVSWYGSDGVLGPGIESYSVYVSKNDGPYEEWISRSTDTTATFIGEAGSEYKFYSTIHLLNGFSEDAPVGFDASTKIRGIGIESFEKQNKIVIYPNPGSSVLNIQSSNQKELAVRITSLDGKVVGTYQLERLESAIDVSFLTQGCYFVEVYSGRTKSVFRWIKE